MCATVLSAPFRSAEMEAMLNSGAGGDTESDGEAVADDDDEEDDFAALEALLDG